METNYLSDVRDFMSRAGDLLAKDEAKYGLIYGITSRLMDNPKAYGTAVPWFCTLEEGTELRAVAIRTPPFKVLLAYFSGDPSSAAEHLAGAISEFSPIIPGTMGEKEIAEPFVENWCKEHGVSVEDKMAERVYRLDRVNDIIYAHGVFRPAAEMDKPLLVSWAHAFYDEVYAVASESEEAGDFAGRIDSKEVYVWEDGVTVSMAAKCLPTENGIGINTVYTPPELRGKGYATSCVAMLCKDILNSGCKFCTLYADLANPISNSIYRRIGFQEVCDTVMYTFSKAGI